MMPARPVALALSTMMAVLLVLPAEAQAPGFMMRKPLMTRFFIFVFRRR